MTHNHYCKYPRTFHVPFSPGATNDDKVLNHLDAFAGKQVIVTEKMDGENTSLYNNNYHARSIDSRYHPSRSWLAQFHGSVGHTIPPGWRVCGENLYALHSIGYTQLPSYFLAFSVWNSENVALGWSDTVDFCNQRGIRTVPVMYEGIFDESKLIKLASKLDASVTEGFVVRLADQFRFHDFGTSVAKWVRTNHVTTDKHWTRSEMILNKLVSAPQ